jgi:hypothetical protein
MKGATTAHEQRLYPINAARQRLAGLSRNTHYRMLGGDEPASDLLRSRRFVRMN